MSSLGGIIGYALEQRRSAARHGRLDHWTKQVESISLTLEVAFIERVR